jgi:hypothetical protein
MKLEQQELQALSELQTTYATLCMAMGQLEFAKLQLDKDYVEATQQYQVLIEKEKTLAEQLSSKYGVGTVNLESGEFISNNTDGDTT